MNRVVTNGIGRAWRNLSAAQAARAMPLSA